MASQGRSGFQVLDDLITVCLMCKLRPRLAGASGISEQPAAQRSLDLADDAESNMPPPPPQQLQQQPQQQRPDTSFVHQPWATRSRHEVCFFVHLHEGQLCIPLIVITLRPFACTRSGHGNACRNFETQCRNVTAESLACHLQQCFQLTSRALNGLVSSTTQHSGYDSASAPADNP